MVVIVLILLCSLSQTVKWIGAGLLYLPDRLGFIRVVKASEVVPVDLSQQSNGVDFTTAGRYQVFVDDLDLLKLTDDMAIGNAPPWMTVTSADTGARLDLTYVQRGLLPYDTPVVPGRPVLAFVVSEPGEYTLVHTTRRVTVWLVPDYTTGSEGKILGAMGAQVLVILMILGALYIQRQQKRQDRLDSLRQALPKP